LSDEEFKNQENSCLVLALDEEGCTSTRKEPKDEAYNEG
jgi:hypothetical protein